MFCTNCGAEVSGKFCSNCGAAVENPNISDTSNINEALTLNINGIEIDVNAVIRTYGAGMRKIGAYSYLVTNAGISNQQAHEILDLDHSQ